MSIAVVHKNRVPIAAFFATMGSVGCRNTLRPIKNYFASALLRSDSLGPIGLEIGGVCLGELLTLDMAGEAAAAW